MRRLFYVLLILVLFASGCSNSQNGSKLNENIIPESGPVQLHPENPHYFLYKGGPLALITSAEHYGALLNLDFDYKKYLADKYPNFNEAELEAYRRSGSTQSDSSSGPRSSNRSSPYAEHRRC